MLAEKMVVCANEIILSEDAKSNETILLPWLANRDEEGNIWFSINGSGIAKYDGRSIASFTRANGLLSDDVHAMVISKKNN